MTCEAAWPEGASRRVRSPVLSTADLWRRIEAAAAFTLAVPLREVQAPKRCRADAVFARQVAMYLARVVLGIRYRTIGRLCGRDHKTVAYACRVVEQRRDDPEIDRMLNVLESLCGDMADDPGMRRARA